MFWMRIPPATRGIRIQNMQHTFHPWPGSATVNLPSSGNLLALTTPVNTGPDALTSVTDSKSNTWTKAAAERLGSPQVWYAVSAVRASALAISFDVGSRTGISVTACDITRRAPAPFDTFA